MWYNSKNSFIVYIDNAEKYNKDKIRRQMAADKDTTVQDQTHSTETTEQKSRRSRGEYRNGRRYLSKRKSGERIPEHKITVLQRPLLTPRQQKAELAKQRRKTWRRKIQSRVNLNEIMAPQHCDFVIFDLEGAGYLEEDITEIAAIKVSREGELLATYQQLIHPITKLNKRVVAMTGITEAMLADKPRLSEVLDDFFAFVGNHIVLGHDIGYNDIMSLNLACRRFGHTKLFLPRFLDTERIAKRMLPTETGGKFGLDALMKYYSLCADKEHRALEDCYSTLAVYNCLLKEHEHRQQNQTVNETA